MKNVTRLSGVKSLHYLKKFYPVSRFRIGGYYTVGDESSYEYGGQEGVTLESLGERPLRTAYIAVGRPERDDQGRIINAIIISPYYSGDSTWCYYYWFDGQPGTAFSNGAVIGPGGLIDTDKFYVIFLDALGIWGASKPSDGLGLKFPRYTVFDIVQANYRLLIDELNVGQVVLATGVSSGATQSYVWSLLHPGFVKAIMPIGGTTSTVKDPVVRWIFQLMTEAMKSDPVWRATEGNYYHLQKDQHPAEGLMFGWSILMHNGYALDYRIDQGWEEVRKEVYSSEPIDDQGLALRDLARSYDANDLILRNSTQDAYDIDEYLPNLKARTLVLHVENDLWLRAKLARESARRIPGAKLATFSSPLAHYAVFRAPNVLSEVVISFFKDIGLK